MNCLKYNPENRANPWANIEKEQRALAHGLLGLVGFRAGAALQILNFELS